MTGAGTGLPTPTKSRWSPLRIGLVELFHYDEQEFWFRDGRLLLRGNNGTGKSKVLALTLPLLLDADLSAHRVEPDGDSGKKMEWNLLLDGAHEERLGYSWLELGRLTASGQAEFLTVGLGVKAVRGRGVADRWFFLTDSCRMGHDLRLVSPTGTVLSRDRLEEVLTGRGRVLRTADAYRRALDEHLFHLGGERYEALMDLLVQLRQPQLTRRPDEARLSAALSQALTPVDQAILTDVAAAMHDLEQQREELAALRDAREHVDRFLRRYGAYARVAARRAARVVRSVQSETDELGRQLGAVRTEMAEHEEAVAQDEGVLEALHDRITALDATREELASSPEVKELDNLRQQRDLTSAALERARGDELQAAARSETASQRSVRAQGNVLEARREVDGASQRTMGLAETSGLVPAHEANLPAGSPLTEPLRQTLVAAAERRKTACRQVEALVDAVRDADVALSQERRLLSVREGELDTAREHARAREDAVVAAADEHVVAWRTYVAGLQALAPDHPDDLGLAQWAETLEGPHPAVQAVQLAATNAERVLAEHRAGAGAELRDVSAEIEALETERGEVEAAAVLAPAPPHTRGPQARAGRTGAPFWRLVEFADDLPAAERAGLEAALEASGVLDAWVSPDGELVDLEDDVLLTVGDAVPAQRCLAEVLRPAEPELAEPEPVGAGGRADGVPSPDVVRRLLETIGRGEQQAGTWMGTDGRFRLGPVQGSWHKAEATYLGTAEREAARSRRLAELAEAITAATARAQALRARITDLDGQAAAVAEERGSMPSDDALRKAFAARLDADRRVDAATDVVARQEQKLVTALEVQAQAVRRRDSAASDLGLPVDPKGLRDVQEAIVGYVESLTALLRVSVAMLAVTQEAQERAADEVLASQDHQLRRERLQTAAQEAAAAQARFTAREGSVGKTVEQIQANLAEVVAELRSATARKKEADKRLLDAREALFTARGRQAQLQQSLAEQQHRRDEAVAGFRDFAGTGLLAIAVPDLELPDPGASWAADPTVRLSRRVEAALAQTDDGESAWRRVQDDVTRQFTELGQAMSRHGHTASSELRADRYVVTISYLGRERSPSELVRLLEDEVAHRDRLLSAKERQVLEEHLVNDVAGHLQRLITEAEAQVSAMNAELEERPTSTGMRIRLTWQVLPDGPEGLAQARSHLLRQTSHLWSPADREAVAAFLARQIERERLNQDAGTWLESLGRALDYRAWHRFTIERYQDGRWRPGTGPASGGERVLTVSLPLFAAASAHYRSAQPDAPRLVMLDEAFAGVDDDSRAKCLGLLATFDLDVIMTSEREWGFYATVPGIATHHLVRRDGVDAVHVTSWEWDGVRAQVVPARSGPPRGPGAERMEPDDEGGLF